MCLEDFSLRDEEKGDYEKDGNYKEDDDNEHHKYGTYSIIKIIHHFQGA